MRVANACAAINEWGPAISHLVLAIEETIKADVLSDRLYLGLKSNYPDSEIGRILSFHEARHPLARERWLELPDIEEFLQQLVQQGMSRRKALEEAFAHAWSLRERVLPDDWENRAKPLREGGFYVTFDGQRWKQPSEATRDEYESLLPRVRALLDQTHDRLALARQIERLGARRPTGHSDP